MTPEITTTIAEVRRRLDAARAPGGRVGIVPTMGYLHAGHAALIERAATENDVTVVSIFVNPLQFGAGEDLGSYPRDLPRDLDVCGRAGADVVFAPDVDEMYPEPIRTTVTVAGVSDPLEGERRPGHFSGVATVVAKLFSILGPGRAYFGEKDWQQLAVIRRMACDLSMPIDVIGCPTVREPDGLAMSSRNVYLTPTDRERATVLHRALRAGADVIEGGERDARAVRASMMSVLEPAVDAVDYADVVDAATLAPVHPLGGEVRLLVAASVGKARLIDNIGLVVPGLRT